MVLSTEPPVRPPITQVEVRQLRPGQESEWDRFVLSSASATFFHLSQWKRVVEKALSHPTYYFIALNDSGVSGVFPISWVRSKIFGNCLVSLPLGVYGGICADDEDSYYSLLRAGTDLAHRLGVNYLEMRNRTEPFEISLPRRDLYVTFVQELSTGPENLFQALPRDTRYMIRKSQKAGLEWTDDLSISEFYEIYARSVHRLGTPVFSRTLFTQLQSEFGKTCKLFGVRKEKRFIAGVLCFYFRDQVLPYYSGALPEFYKDAPNNFMYWSLMAQSCREGYHYFDFGRSKRGTGSFQFKSSWSMQIADLPYRYELVRAKEVPQLSPVDRKFRMPVELWKRLPFPLTKLLGPRLIRLVPSV